MQKNDTKEFIDLLINLSEIFNNGNPLSEKAVEIYFFILNEFSIKDVENAVNFLLRNRTMHGFPKPAEIIQSIEDSKNDGYR